MTYNNIIPPKKVLKNDLCSVYGCNNLTNYLESRGIISIRLCKEHRECKACGSTFKILPKSDFCSLECENVYKDNKESIDKAFKEGYYIF